MRKAFNSLKREAKLDTKPKYEPPVLSPSGYSEFEMQATPSQNISLNDD